MPNPSIDAVFGQPPQRAIEYLEQKAIIPSQDWWTIQSNAHNRAFVVAHMTQLDLLEDVRKSLIDAQKKGWNLKQWSENIEPTMRAKGWWGKREIETEAGTREVQLGSPYRLKTIYETNMAQAYEAGRQSVMWDGDNTLFPYVQYSAIMDNKTRPHHAALHGVVMRKSDPAWKYIAPKNGYKCRCTAFELMEMDVQAQNLKVYDSTGHLHIDEVDVNNGGLAKVARLELPDRPVFKTDAGWVGRPNDSPINLLLEKAVTAEPQLASGIVNQTFKNNSVVKQYNEEVKQWIKAVDPARPKGEIKQVGVIPNSFIDRISNQSGIVLETAAITIHDKDTISHISKERKKHDQEWFENIVEHLTQPHDLYWDVRHNNAALVFDIKKADQVYKMVVQLNRQIKGRENGERISKVGNLIRTIVIEQSINLEKGSDYILLGRWDGK